jgi:hypothetical protein
MSYFKTWLNVDILMYKYLNCRLSTGCIFVCYVLYETWSLRQIVILPITFKCTHYHLSDGGGNTCKTIVADISMKFIVYRDVEMNGDISYTV